ncbi:Uncharacterised protein [Vibrio cholerae]|nr:Uncharacterised protein [Vibrio cholerae]
MLRDLRHTAWHWTVAFSLGEPMTPPCVPRKRDVADH